MQKLYTPNVVHRNLAQGKSQWTIPEAEEIQCFRNSDESGWVSDVVGWGLHDIKGSIGYVGIDRNGAGAVVAKFIDSSPSGAWHGYPASQTERPSESVLANWLNRELLRPKAIKNISRGMRCYL